MLAPQAYDSSCVALPTSVAAQGHVRPRAGAPRAKSGMFHTRIEGLTLTLSVRLQLRKAMFAPALAHHMAKCGMF